MKNFICGPCNYHTTDKSNYAKHIKSTKHTKKVNNQEDTGKVFSCTECIYTTKHKGNYNRHVIMHSTEPKQHYRYECLACNEHVRDLYNLASHCRKETHILSVRTKYPETLKKKQVGSVFISFSPLDLSKRHVYVKDKSPKGSTPKLTTYRIHTKPEPIETVQQSIRVKEFFEHEYFDLNDEDKKTKVNTMMDILPAQFIEDEFPNVKEHIEVQDWDDAYCDFYTFFKQDNIEQYLRDMGEHLPNISFN